MTQPWNIEKEKKAKRNKTERKRKSSSRVADREREEGRGVIKREALTLLIEEKFKADPSFEISICKSSKCRVAMRGPPVCTRKKRKKEKLSILNFVSVPKLIPKAVPKIRPFCFVCDVKISTGEDMCDLCRVKYG